MNGLQCKTKEEYYHFLRKVYGMTAIEAWQYAKTAFHPDFEKLIRKALNRDHSS